MAPDIDVRCIQVNHKQLTKPFMTFLTFSERGSTFDIRIGDRLLTSESDVYKIVVTPVVTYKVYPPQQT